MIHDPIDIAGMLRAAGWTNRHNRRIALAVCWAESSLNDQAVNENLDEEGQVDSIDRGLMQINSKWQPQVTEECAFDPVCNLAAAYEIYKGRSFSFSAWNAWKNGAFQRHLVAAQVAVEAEVRLRMQAAEHDIQLAQHEDLVRRLYAQVAESVAAYAGAQERYDAEAARVRALIFA